MIEWEQALAARDMTYLFLFALTALLYWIYRRLPSPRQYAARGAFLGGFVVAYIASVVYAL